LERIEVPDGYPAMKEHCLKRPALGMELLMALAASLVAGMFAWYAVLVWGLPLRLKGVRLGGQREVVKKVTFTLLLTEPVPFSLLIPGSRKAVVNFSR
jgi:hypothetical protein